jgi:hypothetical protein
MDLTCPECGKWNCNCDSDDSIMNPPSGYKQKDFKKLKSFLVKGDKVIYHNSKSKFDGKEFEYVEVRDDGKLKLKDGNIIFYATVGKVEKI